MDEFELINRLKRSLAANGSVVTGVGDDCAVIDVGLPERWCLLKTDAVVEGIHFLSAVEPRRVGHKALARCLSDIAAMGGAPSNALVTLGLPDPFDPRYVEELYEGMNALARRYSVAIVGGETTTNPERMFISVAVMGWVDRQQCILRSGARIGDALFVSGDLGGSLLGKHLDFEPRLKESQWLARHFHPHSMIDLSDGLAGDLRHLIEGNTMGAELMASAIPISAAAKQSCLSSGKQPLQCALCDGEDFELLFTLPPEQAVPLIDAWKLEFPNTRLSCIGKVLSTPGISLRTRDGVRLMNEGGYVHFHN